MKSHNYDKNVMKYTQMYTFCMDVYLWHDTVDTYYYWMANGCCGAAYAIYWSIEQQFVPIDLQS